ncbi:hypothetical protein yc1106_09954 [Curvularia clavata]|uniref:Uncharacterized protein n=1 Tax=Curvularia clavata TaxID=95742 RepID=A0A9Q8ZI90_CURCL|nr:hypothetical protein yc1106_09954 [Curvularia clavata]
MAGKKRSANGQVKPQTHSTPPAGDITMANDTPPCGQPQPPSSKTASTPSAIPERQDKLENSQPESTSKPAAHTSIPHSTTRQKREKRQKLPKLPPNTSITKRPLLHPALPTPFASSSSPKTLYITASTPYIPALKRVRKLLAQITRRHKQSLSASKKASSRGGYLEANGRLEAGAVEREIVGEAGRKGEQGAAEEEVYLKATGRAIPRALEIGLYFQEDGEFRVRIEMGSVVAVDDVEDKRQAGGSEEEGKEEEEIPETRLRTLSSVTVSIGFK